MSIKPEPGQIQTGWRLWYAPAGATSISQIVEYNSTDHDWVIDVPKEGVQAMIRYYNNKPEVIKSKNFYTETYADLTAIALASTNYKQGSLNTDLYYEMVALVQQVEAKIEDNTIEKYISNKKRFQGVVVFYDDNGTLAYTKDWNSAPNTGIIGVYRIFKEGPSEWIERLSREDLYALTREDEPSEKDLHPKLKLGSLTDISIQDHIGAVLIPGAISGN